MGVWRIWGSLVIVIAASPTAVGQTYSLIESSKPGACFHVHHTMSLSGEMKVVRDQKPAALTLTAEATHDFSERILNVDPKEGIQKTARAYEIAKAIIALAGDKSERTLRKDRRLVIAQRSQGQALAYCPAGPMTQEELELTAGHLDTLALPGLLPHRPVAVGETWKAVNDTVQALCSFEGLTAQELVCKLDEVKDDVARISISGNASGIELGALVKLTIQATLSFNLKSNSLAAVEWKQKDDRGQGPASPATAVESKTMLTREPIDQTDSVSDIALISVPDGLTPPAAMTQLMHNHQFKAPFKLLYAREWQLVGDTNEHVIFRLLDRGDFVGQVTVTPWEKARPGEHLSPDAFRDAMSKTPGWAQGEVVQEGEVEGDRGLWVYRIVAPGRMDGIEVVQNFYLVAGAGGEQVVLAFTMKPNQVDKMGSRDLGFVQGLELLTKKKD